VARVAATSALTPTTAMSFVLSGTRAVRKIRDSHRLIEVEKEIPQTKWRKIKPKAQDWQQKIIHF